ncbi:RecA-like DNA recombinase [Bacillus phage 015DV002]|nr:RecA-like DNA recombinase [Bacillus phage 015DV002]
MARKKQNKPVAVDIDLSSLADDAGLTLLRDSDYALVKDRLPTFLPRVDKVFGGGLPFGRMIEVAGKPGGGKSTLAFHVSRVATNLGCIVVLIDVEGTADRERLAHLGIDVSKILVKQPDPSSGISLTVEEIGRTVEQCLELFTKKYPGVPVVFVWDSVGITPSQDELDKDFGDKNVGSRAKAITQFVTKVAPMITEAKAMLIGINQVRDDIGGNPMFAVDKVPGGKAWEHYASLRLVVKAKTAIKKGTDKIGHNLGIKVNKSKVSRPFQEAQAFLISDNGLDYEYNLAKMAEEDGVLPVKGQSYEYVDRNGEIHKMKKDNFIDWLRTPEGQPVREEILNKLVELEYPDGTYPAFNNENLDIVGWIDKVVPQATSSTTNEEVETSGSAEDLIADVQNEITGEIG